MKQPSLPTVTGPFESYAAGYRGELTRLGYSRWTASAHMYLMADVSRWLGEGGLAPADFSSVRVGQFLADRRARGHVRRLTPRALIPLLGYLHRLDVLPPESLAEPGDPVGRLLEEFVEHLTTERGLAPGTIVGYRRVAGSFVIKCAPDTGVEGCGVDRVGAEQINAFLLSENVHRSVGSANNMVTALRALMRFLYLRGYTAASLAIACPAVLDGGTAGGHGPWRRAT